VLALKELNDSGGIGNRQVQAIYEDSKCDPQTGVSAVQKLINIDHVRFIIGDVCSPVVVPVAPIAEANKVVVLAQGSSPDITNLGDYIFRNWPSDAYQGKVVADYVFGDLGLKKAALLVENQAYATGLADAFSSNFTHDGGQVTETEYYKTGDKDYRTQLSKIKAQKPDAIYIAVSTDFGLIAKQIRELKIDAQIIGADGLGSQQSLSDAQGSLEGAYYGFPAFDEKSQIVIDFQNKYQAMFGTTSPFVNVSAHGYDAVNIMAIALRSCLPDLDTGCVKDKLYSIKDFPGVSGNTTFDKNGDVQKPYSIYKIVGNKPVVVK